MKGVRSKELNRREHQATYQVPGAQSRCRVTFCLTVVVTLTGSTATGAERDAPTPSVRDRLASPMAATLALRRVSSAALTAVMLTEMTTLPASARSDRVGNGTSYSAASRSRS